MTELTRIVLRQLIQRIARNASSTMLMTTSFTRRAKREKHDYTDIASSCPCSTPPVASAHPSSRALVLEMFRCAVVADARLRALTVREVGTQELIRILSRKLQICINAGVYDRMTMTMFEQGPPGCGHATKQRLSHTSAKTPPHPSHVNQVSP